MELKPHRDKLGLLTAEPMRFAEADCGHYLRMDMLQDEACPFCLEYEEARVRAITADADTALFG